MTSSSYRTTPRPSAHSPQPAISRPGPSGPLVVLIRWPGRHRYARACRVGRPRAVRGTVTVVLTGNPILPRVRAVTARLVGRVRLRRVGVLAVAGADGGHLVLAGAGGLAFRAAHGQQGEHEYECEGAPCADGDDDAGGRSVGQGLDLRAGREHRCPFFACVFADANRTGMVPARPRRTRVARWLHSKRGACPAGLLAR